MLRTARRTVRWVIWSLIGAGAMIIGAGWGLLRTSYGRDVVARFVEERVTAALSGSISIGGLSGSFWTGLVMSDVIIRDEDSTEVASVRRVEVRYRPDELWRGGVRVRQLVVRSPHVRIVRDSTGELNVARLFDLGGTAKVDTGPPPLVRLNNVTIHDGSVDLALDADRPREVRNLNLAVRTIRLSSPTEPGIEAEVTHIAGELSDPAIVLHELTGRVYQHGDSLVLDLPELAFGSTRAGGSGVLRWGDGLALDASIDGRRVSFADIAFIDDVLPTRGEARSQVRLRLDPDGAVHVDATDLDYIDGRARMAGALRVDAGGGATRIRELDVDGVDVDLALVRHFVSGFPFEGRVTGQVRLSGPLDSLSSAFDIEFADRLPGNPRSFLTASGLLRTGGEDGVLFDTIDVRSAAVATETIRNFVPGFALAGQIGAIGTLSGPLRDARFDGTLEHRDRDVPVTVVRGPVRLDTRGAEARFEGDVEVSPLALEGIQRGYPSIPVRPISDGRLRFEGTLSRMELDGDLSLGTGRVRGRAVGHLSDSLIGVSDADLTFDRADPAALGIGAPDGAMSMRARGTLLVPSEGMPTGRVRIEGGASVLAAALIDTMVVDAVVIDGNVHFGELHAALPGLSASGRGSIPWRGDERTSLELRMASDTLAPIESLARWLLRPDIPSDEVGPALDGRVDVAVTVDGHRDSVEIGISAVTPELSWLDLFVLDGVLEGRATLASATTLDLSASADSIVLGRWEVHDASLEARGTTDSLHWSARSDIGLGGGVNGGGWLVSADTATVIDVDSLAVLAPVGVWVLDGGARIARTTDAWVIDDVTFLPRVGSGEVSLGGRLAARGRVDWRITARDYPIVNLYDLAQFDTVGVSGVVNVTVQGSGTARAPLMHASLELIDDEEKPFLAPAVDGTFRYQDRALEGRLLLWANVDRTGDRMLDITVRLPIDLAFTEVAQRRLPQPLEIRATADGVNMSDWKRVLDRLVPTIQDVSGQLNADVAITGTWDDPALTGSLEITDGAATYPALNARHRDVQGMLRLHGDTVEVERMTLRSGGGSLSIEGYVQLLELTQPRLNLLLNARRFHTLELRDQVDFTASGEVRITGPFIGATLSGRATIDEGVLYFADLVSKRVINLQDPGIRALFDDEELRDELIQRRIDRPPLASRFLDSLRVDSLDLVMGSDVWLRSNEANIQLSGRLLASKDRAMYLLDGPLDAERGNYRLDLGTGDLPLVSRRFEVTGGTVRFLGTKDFNADLDIEAQHVVRTVSPQETQQDITIIAQIRGTLLVPELTLTTDLEAPLTDREIISYLIFGQPDPVGSGQAGVWVVDQIAASLSGELERFLVSDLRIPVDYIEINWGSYNSPYGIAGGWQLNRKLFLVFGTGFCAPSSRGRQSLATRFTVGAQYRISPDFRTELSVQPVGNCLASSLDRGTLHQLGFDVFFDKSY